MIKKRILMSASLLILSCDGAMLGGVQQSSDCAPDIEAADFMTMPPDAGYCQPAMWVCHNPGSKLHNQVCTPDCMVEGDHTTYCWYRESDCG